ncbi:methyl-accepting chemotaxis protein [Paraburkholderia sp. J41]|uniref:methyl-accepting chemotaxis protein n=1 Tax=Paraburkholderia sp. J41 TaxID=2805433 RepID=UPI002AC355EF|nr:methyl-accepting chemotaxis protein [Paraburkholderia sp. J41]
MRRFSVRGQLIGGFGVLLLALVALAAVSLYQVRNIRMRLDDIIDVNGVKERYAINFRGSVHDRSIAVRDVLLVSPADLPGVVDHIQQLAGDYERSAQPLDRLFAANAGIVPAERAIYARINAARERTMPLVGDIIARQRSGDTEGARRVLLDEARPAFIEWLAGINALIDFEEARSEKQGAEARRISADFNLFMGLLAAIACALGTGTAWFVVRNIGRTLGADPRDLIAFAEAIRGGDLARDVALQENDTASVMATVARMRDTLAEIVAQVRGAAEGVSEASHEIAQGNADLGERTGRQASALEQANSALSEFDASVAANAGNAKHADALSKQASTTASDGGLAVGRVTESMHGIRTSSARIGEIIAVINSIAFQTNILALNAAVEAARAGSHGRGFAVVASEVRKLAQHSAEAASEVKSLVEDSVSRVNEGTREVDAAGATIAKVVTSSGDVMSIMGEINDACRAQTQQIGEVRDMIDHLERATQQNVALVEQSGSAVASLQAQAGTLLATVDLFTLARHAQTAVSPQRAGKPHAAGSKRSSASRTASALA